MGKTTRGVEHIVAVLSSADLDVRLVSSDHGPITIVD